MKNDSLVKRIRRAMCGETRPWGSSDDERGHPRAAPMIVPPAPGQDVSGQGSTSELLLLRQEKQEILEKTRNLTKRNKRLKEDLGQLKERQAEMKNQISVLKAEKRAFRDKARRLSRLSSETESSELVQLRRYAKRQEALVRRANELVASEFGDLGLDFDDEIPLCELPSSMAFATAVDDGFVSGLECLIYSIQKVHPELGHRFYVFHDEGLSEKSRDYLRSVYEGFYFVRVNEEDYEGIPLHKRIGLTSFYALEAFRIPDFEHVLLVDADSIVLQQIGAIFRDHDTISACLNIGETLIPFPVAESKNLVFNSGVMVLPKKVREHYHFEALIDAARAVVGKDDPAIARFADQRVLNHYFRNDTVRIIPPNYNCLVKLADSHPHYDLSKVAIAHFAGVKPWSADLDYSELSPAQTALFRTWSDHYVEARQKHRIAYFKKSGAYDRILRLRGTAEGKRAFVLGNGPSLAHQDLTLLKNELTFVGNWFALHEEFEKICPSFYCVCSHTVFGGWAAEKPELEESFKTLLQEKTQGIPKVFSFEYRDYLMESGIFPDEELYYLIFEKPLKQFVDSVSSFHFDAERPLLDGHTVVITFGMMLAAWMGAKEIILLGCDCDYGTEQEGDEKKYFYDSKYHTTQTSRFSHLQKVWSAEGGRVFRAYEIVRAHLESKGIRVFNATHGGRLEVFERVSFNDVVKG